MAKYFYSSEGRTHGPIHPQDLMSLILDDVLNTDSYVMEMKNPAWRKIKDIPELMRYLHESDVRLSPTRDDISLDNTDDREPLFFYIPVSKLVLWSILSMGWYEIYWFYQNWKYLRYRRKRKTSISFWRDIINPFAISGVFFSISTDPELSKGVAPRNFAHIGWMWILSSVLMSVFTNGVLSFLTPATVILDIVGSMISLGCSLLFIIPVQKHINEGNAKLGRHPSQPALGHYLLVTLILLLIFGVLWVAVASHWVTELIFRSTQLPIKPTP